MAEIVPAGSRPPMPLTLPDMESIEPVHFDGWTAEDLDGWLTSVLPAFATIRRGIGLALWHLRQRVEDGEYGRLAGKYAKVAGVTATTVGRWRTAAEDYYSLDSPSKRTDAQRTRELSLTTHRRKSKPQQGSAPVLLAEGDPAPDPVGVVRGERQRPEKPKGRTPAPAEPSTNGGGLDDTERLRQKLADAIAEPGYGAKVEQVKAHVDGMDAYDLTDPCPRCKGTGRVDKPTPKVNNGCGHALIRRLGSKCQDCGEVVGPAPFANKR